MAAEVKEYIPNVNSKPHVKISSDKFKANFYCQPTIGGYVFYEIKIDQGQLPAELQGRYTRMKYAVDAVLDYERRAKPTPAVERDKKAEIRNAAKVQRASAELLREGTGDGEEPANLS